MKTYLALFKSNMRLTLRDRGAYEDTCVKRDGRWLFKSRSFRNIHRQTAPKGT